MDREISPSPVNDNALLNLPLCSLDTLSWPQHIYLPIRGSRLGRRKHSVTFEAFQRLKRTSLFSTSLKASPPFQWNVISRRWCHAMEHSWGENKYPNELLCPGGIAPLCTISNLSHMDWGGNLIDPVLNYFFLHSFISTGCTDKLFDHKALLSAKSHFRVVMANDLASWLREKSGSQHVFEAHQRQGHREDWTKH